MSTKRNFLILGASSGIGLALAEQLLGKGHNVGVVGRRIDPLMALEKRFSPQCFQRKIDATSSTATNEIAILVEQMGGLDCFIFCAGVGFHNTILNEHIEEETLLLNVVAFTKIIVWATTFFDAQNKGQLVNISSVGMHRGNKSAPAYNASKAYQSNYLEGLRQRACAQQSTIIYTDIRPGFVDTAMAKGPGLFWVSSPKKAARQIIKAIERKKAVAYITRRWQLIGWLLHLLPRSLYKRL